MTPVCESSWWQGSPVSFHACTWLKHCWLFGRKLFIKKKRFVKTTQLINRLRSVKISLRTEANIWTQEKGEDQCSVSLPVFFLIPQDNSVSAESTPPPSHSHLFISPSVSNSAHIHSPHLLSSPQTPLVPCLSLSLSPSLSLLLHSSASPWGLSCLLFISFSSNGGWRRVSPARLALGCCGNNSCHFAV